MIDFNTFLAEASGDKAAYKKFFDGLLKKFGVKSPAELDADKKKEFYDAVDKGWDGDNEVEEDCGDDHEDNEIDEGKYSAALIKKALKIAKKSTGDYDHAWAAIEKLKKGLADLDIVAKALKTANEDKND